MSEKVHKKIRRVARKVADKRFIAMVGEIGQLPLRQRLWFALKIIKGAG